MTDDDWNVIEQDEALFDVIYRGIQIGEVGKLDSGKWYALFAGSEVSTDDDVDLGEEFKDRDQAEQALRDYVKQSS